MSKTRRLTVGDIRRRYAAGAAGFTRADVDLLLSRITSLERDVQDANTPPVESDPADELVQSAELWGTPQKDGTP